MFSLQAGQAELIALEKALKEAMVSAGTAREVSLIDYFAMVTAALLCFASVFFFEPSGNLVLQYLG